MSTTEQAIAADMIERYGVKGARIISNEDRDRHSFGTYSYAFHNAIAKEIERIAEARGDDARATEG